MLGLVSTRNPYRLPGGPPLLTAGEIRQRLECRPQGSHGHQRSNTNSLQKPPEPKPRKGPSHARCRTDHETKEPDPGIACPQRDRAQNPVNTTRTCNKLPHVYM